jgi:hypothetical protein
VEAAQLEVVPVPVPVPVPVLVPVLVPVVKPLVVQRPSCRLRCCHPRHRRNLA